MCLPKPLLSFLYFTGHLFMSLPCSYVGPCDRLIANGVWVELTQVTSISDPNDVLHDLLCSSSSLTLEDDSHTRNSPEHSYPIFLERGIKLC